MLEGRLHIVSPADILPIEQVALKDVPSGVPFKIVDASIFPENREYRNAWEADMTNPDGFGIGPDAWFELQNENKDDNN